MTILNRSTVPPRLVPSGASPLVLSGANRLVPSGACCSCYQAHEPPKRPGFLGRIADSNVSNRVFQTLSNDPLCGKAVDRFRGHATRSIRTRRTGDRR